MAGSLLPDTHRLEETVIREYPYPMPGPIRPQGLDNIVLSEDIIDLNTLLIRP
jgi:hypothetical protein